MLEAVRKDTVMTATAPRRWAVHGLDTISSILVDEDCCGIYVLEFENDEYYVGQARDVRKRFANHCRDTSHHPAWKDITHVSFKAHPAQELNVREATMIQHLQKEGKKLRNRSLNLFHEQPSPLDEIIPPVDQFHWADSEYLGRNAVQLSADQLGSAIAALPPSHSKMSRLPHYEGCLHDLAAFIDLVLPAPLATMERFWTISDTPSTNKGRYYTLNVGVLEMLRCISAFSESSFLNTLPWPELTDLDEGMGMRLVFDDLPDVPVIVSNNAYPKAEVTVVEYPTGRLRELLEFEEETLASARALAVALMRTGTAGMFRRWHSRELTREALTLLWEEVDARK